MTEWTNHPEWRLRGCNTPSILVTSTASSSECTPITFFKSVNEQFAFPRGNSERLLCPLKHSGILRVRLTSKSLHRNLEDPRLHQRRVLRPSCSGRTSGIVDTLDGIPDIEQPAQDKPHVSKSEVGQSNTLTPVVILRAPNSLDHIPCNACLDMPPHQTCLCTRRVDLDPPPFVHVGSRSTPGVDVEHDV